MGGFVLRVKTKSGQKIVESLTPQDTLSKLKHKLSELTGVQSNFIHVLRGYPPQAIDMSNSSATLQDSNILSGETLIVEEKQVTNTTTEVEVEDNTARAHITDSANFDEDCPGILMKMVVPSDNSCLFTSIGFVFSGKVDPSCAPDMREIVVNELQSDPELYNESFLGKPNKEYCDWLRQPSSWGGAIELSILSKHYGLEIAVCNSTSGNIQRYGEDKNYGQRVFLIFDGIHYDPLYLESIDGGKIQSIFLADNETVYVQALSLAQEAQSSHQFTDVNRFTLKCIDCDVKLSGSEAAQKHAKETGHRKFGEVIG
ncbi:ubiquitin thioesterase OTU1 [Copidosoma floridanum]|uniref:ubiquitin thioesterase OTU1 n=1 Tax=Copidosoma floridanum TaxID=29053 RepID=UPI0006C97670|nr:ubiquitin thioesterase OTU1 [Copidosoma floridanum]